jgi:hypothetical protein
VPSSEDPGVPSCSSVIHTTAALQRRCTVRNFWGLSKPLCYQVTRRITITSSFSSRASIPASPDRSGEVSTGPPHGNPVVGRSAAGARGGCRKKGVTVNSDHGGATSHRREKTRGHLVSQRRPPKEEVQSLPQVSCAARPSTTLSVIEGGIGAEKKRVAPRLAGPVLQPAGDGASWTNVDY